jgi:hypothetical protein
MAVAQRESGMMHRLCGSDDGPRRAAPVYPAWLSTHDWLSAHRARPRGLAASALEPAAPLPNPLGLASPARSADRRVVADINGIPRPPTRIET